MPFIDTPEGQTHYYGDGCGIEEHNFVKEGYLQCKECGKIRNTQDAPECPVCKNGGRESAKLPQRGPEVKHYQRGGDSAARVAAPCQTIVSQEKS
jgi:hypothetical protein